MSMKIKHAIKCDFQRPGVRPTVHAKENDMATRFVVCEFFDDGEPYSIPPTATGVVKYAKSDGTGGVYDTIDTGTERERTACVFSENYHKATVELAPNILIGFGLVRIDLSFVGTDEILSTFTFNVQVERSVTDGTKADDYFSYRALDELYDAVDEANANAAEALSSVDTITADMYGGVVIGKNKLDPGKIVLGKYINVNGSLTNNQNYGISAQIPVPAGATHVIASYVSSAGSQSVPTSNVYIGFYRADGSPAGNRVTGQGDIPDGADYILWCGSNTFVNLTDRCMVEFGDQMTAFEPYSETEDGGIKGDVTELAEKIENMGVVVKTTVITVGANKDFADLVSAVRSITDSGETNRYIIHLYPGEYGTVVEAEIVSGYRGLIIPDHVSIIGIGNRDDIVIKGELPSAVYADTANTISTINLTMNGTVENVTITARNIRYCNHDDGTNDTVPGSYVRASHTFKRVRFITYANDSGVTTAGHCVGIGAMLDKEVVFEDCEFIDYRATYGILAHDTNIRNPEGYRGCRLVINRCVFVYPNGGGTSSVCISNSGGDLECYADIINTRLYNNIRVTAATGVTANVWKILAVGNDNYKIVQTGPMEGVDLSDSITAFGNVVAQ